MMQRHTLMHTHNAPFAVEAWVKAVTTPILCTGASGASTYCLLYVVAAVIVPNNFIEKCFAIQTRPLVIRVILGKSVSTGFEKPKKSESGRHLQSRVILVDPAASGSIFSIKL